MVITGLWVAPANAARAPGSYIYGVAGWADNRSTVIKIQGDTASTQSRRHADPSAEPGEFSELIEDCSDVTFVFISGPLTIRVPRDLGLAGWRYRGVTCLGRVQSPGVLRYTCHTMIYGRRVESAYVYSVSRGIVSFRGMPMEGPGWFRLRGSQGIFSNGSLGGKLTVRQ